MPYYRLWCLLSILICCLHHTIYALSFDLPSEGVHVVGKLQWVQAVEGDNFNTIGRLYGVGYHEIMEANPGLSSENIAPGTLIVLPTCFVLPSVPRKGIVINLAELRLYYYDKHSVFTYPVGIGRAKWDTPLGLSYILAKLKDPIWHVPKSIQEASKREGLILPDKVLPGEDNPLGPYALRLHYHNYLIHGTNEVEGVGRRSTAGCIRMFPEDMNELFDKVSKGVLVNIINAPYKLGWDSQQNLYLEAHLPLKSTDVDSLSIQKYITQLVNQAIGHKKIVVAWDTIQRMLHETTGIPIVVSTLANI
jgi:L,D-transpeptidase ErfK/SrfK